MVEKQTGYPGLAKVMGPHPGMALFKRFAVLNARNLLYMQAELIDLELQFDILTSQDHTSSDPRRRAFAKEFLKLSEPLDGLQAQQWQKALEIREKLKEYNAALLQQAEVNALPCANQYDLGILRQWLKHLSGGAGFLCGLEAAPWRDGDEDLVAVSTSLRENLDVITRLTAEKLVPWLHKKGTHRWRTPLPGHEEVGLVEWKDAHFFGLSRVLSVIISTLFPFIAVLVLYLIHNLASRLGAVVAFSFLFWTALAIFTNARPVEIFAATAACASVQVVFVSSTNTAGG